MIPSFRNRAFSAIRWTTVSAIAVASMQVVQTVVLARLLSPADFGLMALASAVTGIMLILGDIGLGKALIHFPDQPGEIRASLYWANLILSVVVAAVGIVLAPVLADLFSQQLAPVLQCTALALPISAFGQQARALAEKQLRFLDLAINEVSSALLGTLLACVAAVNGSGVFALVIGMLTTVSCNALLARLRLHLHEGPRFRMQYREIRSFAKYGVVLVGDTLITALNRNADILIGGAFAQPSALGFYSVPRDLSLKVALVVNPIASRVGFPIMSLIREDRERLARIYAMAASLTGAINFPIYICLGIFAPQFVELLYGPAWAPAGTYLRILAAWGLMRSISNPVGSLLFATGKGRRALIWNLVAMAAFLPALWYGTMKWGLEGLAFTMLFLQSVIFLPGWLFLIRPVAGLTLSRYVIALGRPLIAAGVAGAFALLMGAMVLNSTGRLLVGILCFALAYAGISWKTNREIFAVLGELSTMRRRAAGKS